MENQYDLSELISVDMVNISIQNALYKRNKHISKKINLEKKIKEAEISYPKILAAISSIDLEIQSYNEALLHQPTAERITELQSFISTAESERETLINDSEDMGIVMTQNRRLLAAIEEIYISTADNLLRQLEERKKELENNKGV
jgi:predicted transcriptional regulator